jgi:phosphoglycolate phosphatase-like HAD superfamily hydrolase
MRGRGSGFADRVGVLFNWDGTLISARRAQPWAAQLLGELRDAGRTVGVLTPCASDTFWSAASDHGLDHLVDVAVCAEDVTRSRPDPQPVLVAMATRPYGNDAWVLVSDTCADMVSASIAGVDAIGAAWGEDSEIALLAAGASRVVRNGRDLAGELGIAACASSAAAAVPVPGH